jgi:cytoskeleton protein RodZ
MGELPSSQSTKTPWARWAIPLILAAIVAVAAVYEWMRPAGESRVATQKEAPAPSAPAAPTPPSNAATTSLPNPLASNAPAADAAPPTSADTQSAAALAVPTPTGAAPATETATPGAGAARTQTVDLAFRDTAWVEVRDRDGRVLLTGTNRRGTVQTVSGTPPLAIVIGNALNVTLRYKGEPVDLTPFTQKNIAQLTLP